MRVHVIRTGTANLASVLAALRRCGAAPIVTQTPRDVEQAAHLVFPGVGSFAAVMDTLAEFSLIEPLRQRIAGSRPTLAICLGIQALAQASDESPGVEGLRMIEGRVTRFGPEVRIPQMGWNQIEPGIDCNFMQPGFAYFANSYRLADMPAEWSPSYSDHGGRYVAAIERGGILGCQFHPELSGSWGLALIRRWLWRAEECS